MIIVGSERGSAKELAAHLLNDRDGNEHIAVHELRGFVSGDLEGAFEESYAISRGTKCRKHLFSVSLNPPSHEEVDIQSFEDAIERVEHVNGLTGQPRAIVFHEKEGRRHAHAVWSRIDAGTMTAKNLSHYKLKLQAVSRELYHEHEWRMPEGLARKGHGDPRNYSLAEYQQAKRMEIDPRDLKGAIQDAYATSDNAAAFAHALSERGYTLAKGDRRGHVAVTPEGEVLSISRYVGKKAKDVRAKLGDPNETLPGVDEAKRDMAKDMRKAFIRHAKEAKAQRDDAMDALRDRQSAMIIQQQADRKALEEQHRTRWMTETKARSERLNSGLKGLWQWVTGKRAKIQKQNQMEALQAQARDRRETDKIVAKQLAERREIEVRRQSLVEAHNQTLEDIRDDQKRAREQLRAQQCHQRRSPPRDTPELDR
ncbi:MAG: relaxase [Hoeflea sp.]|uniref:relaxase/mobilization nuclease domain-containing protein n=1 Tax=Hoeflea sp. TaxID=1940281 RepID=UPI0032EC4B39